MPHQGDSRWLAFVRLCYQDNHTAIWDSDSWAFLFIHSMEARGLPGSPQFLDRRSDGLSQGPLDTKIVARCVLVAAPPARKPPLEFFRELGARPSLVSQ